MVRLVAARARASLHAALLGLLILQFPLRGQATCEPSWLPTFGAVPGFDEPAQALTVFDDGSGPALYVGGKFNYAGGVAEARMAKWDGASWSALGSGIGGWVFALTVFDDGSGPALYAGGTFTSAGGTAANSIAKWDGASWSALGSGMDGDDPFVRALTVFDDGSGPALYAGGHFTTAGGVSANSIAKWDGSSWSALGSGVNGPYPYVDALAVFDDGSGPALYAGGSFATAGAAFANDIAKWDGSSWSALGSGMNAYVLALSVFDDGSGPALYAGGWSTTAGGTPANDIAKWDGSTWSALGSGMDGDYPAVSALAVFDDGSSPALYAGGWFITAGGVTVNAIAKWDGANWSPLETGVANESCDKFGDCGSVQALTILDNGGGPALIACGDFITAGAVAALSIATWDGATWSALGSGLNGSVAAMAVFDDGGGQALYVGGGFTSAGSVAANRIARWDGSAWSALGSGISGAYSSVQALAVFDDGSGPALYAGGDFTTAGGAAAKSIAKWNGSTWSALDGGVGGFVDANVSALAVFDDGTGPALYVGGDFITAGSATVDDIAKWDGLAWSVPGSGVGGGVFGGTVEALTVFDDGSGPALYAAGTFTTAGGVAANLIAKWDGSSWSALGNGMSGLYSSVDALSVFDDGSGPALYAGGLFTTAGGVSANSIAKWDGSSWSPLGSGVEWNVYTLGVFDDGSRPALYAGGYFTTAGGVASNSIAKWDGATWSALGDGVSGEYAGVAALEVFADDSGPALYAGGWFTSADSLDSFVAKWGCPPPPALWTDLGFALPGALGAPLLVGLGELTTGSTGRLTLTSAAPSAPSILFLALDSIPSTFKCGTLAPAPVLSSFVLTTSPSGEALLGWSSFPAGFSGFSLFFQYGILDASAVCGVALSNALRADVP